MDASATPQKSRLRKRAKALGQSAAKPRPKPRPQPRGGPQRLAAKLARPVVLVGMMGVGKTTIGRRLARKLRLPFFDADAEIERAAGMTVAELFERHGEESFRSGEAQVILRLVTGPPCVLATGGGALTTPSTRTVLKENALTVWLKADVETLVRRATKRNNRPLLMQGDPEEIITRLLSEREQHYGEADVIVRSRRGPHSRTVAAIIEALEGVAESEPEPRSR
ncbi:MAG: shikimate kinase [Pseudomonadota bacterium]